MEVKVIKEIREYKEALFFGLNLRQCICSLLAILVAVGLYFALDPLVGTEEIGWVCILGAAPFAACGFVKYHGMSAEKLLWAIIKSELLYPKRLVFKSENLYHACLCEAIAAGNPTMQANIMGKLIELFTQALSLFQKAIQKIMKKGEPND